MMLQRDVSCTNLQEMSSTVKNFIIRKQDNDRNNFIDFIRINFSFARGYYYFGMK